jgi:hypothetical protein
MKIEGKIKSTVKKCYKKSVFAVILDKSILLGMWCQPTLSIDFTLSPV